MFELKNRATIQCDWESENGSGCTRTEHLVEDAETRSLEDFNQYSREYFEKKGWKLFGGTRCPHCHQCERDGVIPYQDD